MDGQAAQDQYIDNAMRAVQQKKQVPEIDFTLHTMEDGTQVSTQERVCKGRWRTYTSVTREGCVNHMSQARRTPFATRVFES